MTSDRGLHAVAGRSVDVRAYDGYIGRWSRLFVPSLLAAARVRSGDTVLDVATGPGDAALLALPAVEAGGRVIGADVSPAMLAAARARASALRLVAADGQALPFRDGIFDAVVCQLGLQFFPDPARGLAEFRRVLRAGGRSAVCVLSTAERVPVWGILARVLAEHVPDRRDALQLSFALADAGRLERLLATAGLRDVRVTRETRRGIVDSFDDYWAPIEAGIGQMPQAYLSLPQASRRVVRDEMRARLAPFESGGRFVMELETLIGSGRA